MVEINKSNDGYKIAPNNGCHIASKPIDFNENATSLAISVGVYHHPYKKILTEYLNGIKYPMILIVSIPLPKIWIGSATPVKKIDGKKINVVIPSPIDEEVAIPPTKIATEIDTKILQIIPKIINPQLLYFAQFWICHSGLTIIAQISIQIVPKMQINE